MALAPIVDPGLVAATIAQALGVQERGSQPLDRTEDLPAKQELLLVLDNFEQVGGGSARWRVAAARVRG